MYAKNAWKIKSADHSIYRQIIDVSSTTQVVSLNSCDLFLPVLLQMQEQKNCTHKTWQIRIEIVSNSISKKSFVYLLGKKHHFLFLLYFRIVICWLGGKKCIGKNKKWIVFPESRYANSNNVILFFKGVEGYKKVSC